MQTTKPMEVQRKVVVRTKSGRFTKNKSSAPDVVNHGSVTCCIHLVPEPAHVDVHQIGRRHELVVPDFLEQHRARQQLVASLHHVFEQPELSRQ